jgi:hypothetical protein
LTATHHAPCREVKSVSALCPALAGTVTEDIASTTVPASSHLMLNISPLMIAPFVVRYEPPLYRMWG